MIITCISLLSIWIVLTGNYMLGQHVNEDLIIGIPIGLILATIIVNRIRFR